MNPTLLDPTGSSVDPALASAPAARTRSAGRQALGPRQLAAALPAALRKLDPRELSGSPVMFVVEVGAVACTVLSVAHPSAFAISITVWLWATVVFATLAESVAESRGKAQAASLRASQAQTTARRIDAPG